MAGRQLERSNIQARHIEENAHHLEHDNPLVQLVSSPSTTNTCRNCGGEWPHTNSCCPAKNKACRKCNKLNHFAKVCHSGNLSQYSAKQQHQRRPSRNNIQLVNTPANDNQSSSESSDSEGYCYAVKTNPRKSPLTKLKINNQKVQFTVDTGSTINLINKDTFKQLGNIPLQKTHIKAYPFNSTAPLKMKGKFQTLVES